MPAFFVGGNFWRATADPVRAGSFSREPKTAQERGENENPRESPRVFSRSPRRLRQDFNTNGGGAVHGELPRGGTGEIENPAPAVRSAVVDPHLDRLTVPQIGHHGLGPERQTPMGGSEGVRVEGFAARGLLAVKARSVPGRLAFLGGVAGAGFEGNGGERYGGYEPQEGEADQPGTEPR